MRIGGRLRTLTAVVNGFRGSTRWTLTYPVVSATHSRTATVSEPGLKPMEVASVVINRDRRTNTGACCMDTATRVMLHGSLDLAELPFASPRPGHIGVYGVLRAAERVDTGVSWTGSQPHGAAP